MNAPTTLELANAINSSDRDIIVAYLEGLSWNDRILAISRLSSEHQQLLLLTLAPNDAADVVEALPEETACDLIESLPPEQAADIVEEMQSDHRADLVSSLDEPEMLLCSMDPEEAADTRALSSYDDDEAGGLMITEFLSYEQHSTVAAVMGDLRENAQQYADFDVQYLYILDKDGALAGILPVRELMFAQQDVIISELMGKSIKAISDSTKMEQIKETFDRVSFAALPVSDRFGRMVGVIRRSAIEEAQTEKAEKDYMSAQGIIGGEEVRTLPYFVRTRRRLSWLSINILLNMCGASVIAANQDVLSAVISLAIFLPILSDMSGSAGAQAIGVTIRELSLGLVRPAEIARVLGKEMILGLSLGLCLGILLAILAYVWEGNPYLGLVVGSALAINLVLGVCVGGVLPLVLKRFGYDPALASGLILTTVTDMCGFFIALTLASWFLV
jgi:magnesium transporter